MKLKCKHILLSHKDAENSSHDRPLGEAMSEAERIIKGLKSGEMKFEETAGMYSACASGPRHGGDRASNRQLRTHVGCGRHPSP